MAFGLKSLSVCFLLVLCFILMLQLSTSDGYNVAEKTTYYGFFLKDNSNRKLLVVEAKEAVFKIDEEGKSKKNVEYKVYLRATPMGPNPLHNHGVDPKTKMPRTSP